MKRLLSTLTLATVAMAYNPVSGQPVAPSMAIVRPAGGFVAGGRHTELPLMIVVVGFEDDETAVVEARVTASEGRIRGTQVVDRTRVLFYYRPPAGGGAEIFDIALTLQNGDTLAEAFTLRVPPTVEPSLSLSVEPEVVAVDATEAPQVAAESRDPTVEHLQLFSNARELDVVRATDGGLRLHGDLTLPELPPDAPSFVQIVAVATSATGYSVRATGVKVRAPIRLSVEIPRGHELVVDGSVNRPPPVPATANGQTVMENVQVVYGERLQAFAKAGTVRKPLSVMVPAGFASALVVPLPNQAVADGGTGETLAVIVAPSPIGGDAFWPEIRVEGARLVDVVQRGPRVRVLVLERPAVPRVVRVLLDEQEMAAVEFQAGRAQFLELSSASAGRDERAAVSLRVTDASGAPTDVPIPRVRISGPDGVDLEPVREGAGQYRVSIPSGTPGVAGSEIEVIAEVPPAPTLLGGVVELVRVSTRVQLSGPSPEVAAEPVGDRADPTQRSTPRETEPTENEWGFGLSAAAVAGATPAPLVSYGGGLHFDVRFPFWRRRLSLRIGAEFVRLSGDGTVVVAGSELDATTTVGGFRFPLEVGFAVIKTGGFELMVRGGGALRVQQAGLDVEGERATSLEQIVFAGRASLEGGVRAGPGDVTIGFSVVGLGNSLDSASTDPTRLSGELTGFRGELGYRLWL